MAEDIKNDRILIIMQRWVSGEISTDQANRELTTAGVELPEVTKTQ